MKPYVSIYKSIAGWKAVMYWWNPELGGFWEPWNTGIGYYETAEQAKLEAKNWAEIEGIEYHEP